MFIEICIYIYIYIYIYICLCAGDLLTIQRGKKLIKPIYLEWFLREIMAERRGKIKAFYTEGKEKVGWVK